MIAKQKIGIIVQARMGSTRLPGKVLMYLDKNEKVLELLIKRLKLSKLVDCIVIATTPDEKNLEIIEVTKKFNISYFIGSEENVLERYYKAAKEFELDIIARITSDCPFVDPRILDDMLLFYKENSYDYIQNLDTQTNFPAGFEIEIFSFKTLEKVFHLSKTYYEKEHVTIIIQRHPDDFSIFYYNEDNLKVFKDLRLTIDYEEDLIMVREVYKRLKEKGKPIDFTLEDVIEIVEKNPELMNINKHRI